MNNLAYNKYEWIQYKYKCDRQYKFDIFGHQITDVVFKRGSFVSELWALRERIEAVKSHLTAKLTEVDTQLDEHVQDTEADLKVEKQIHTLNQNKEDVTTDLTSQLASETENVGKQLDEKTKAVEKVKGYLR